MQKNCTPNTCILDGCDRPRHSYGICLMHYKRMKRTGTYDAREGVSEATKEKLRQANLGKKASEETRAKMSEALKGRVHSEETRAKMSAAAIGKPKSEAARANMSAAKKGKPGHPISEKTRQAISRAQKGRTHVAWNKGLKTGFSFWTGKKRPALSDETKAKMSAAQKGRKKSAEHAAKLKFIRVGKLHSEQAKQKNRIAHLGKKHSPEGLANIRRANKARSGPGHQWWGKGCLHGPRTHWVQHNGKALRSSYELRFAKVLDAQGIKWEYEYKRFVLGDCTYLPDFYLPDTGTYWEVKGWMDPQSKMKIERFRELFPDTPLKVADITVIRAMEKAIQDK